MSLRIAVGAGLVSSTPFKAIANAAAESFESSPSPLSEEADGGRHSGGRDTGPEITVFTFGHASGAVFTLWEIELLCSKPRVRLLP